VIDYWNILQEPAWTEQQRRLLTAQFGPREVESLAMNAVLPLDSQAGFAGTPLLWVQTREMKASHSAGHPHTSWQSISPHAGLALAIMCRRAS
jgi:hypothetical protein